MKSPNGHVYVLDDDFSVRSAMARLLKSAKYQAETFESSEQLFAIDRLNEPSCVILDLHLSDGKSGLDVQNQMAAVGFDASVIFVSGEGDIPSSVAAMKGGAIDFLTKPIDESVLLAVVERSLEQNRVRLAEKQRVAEMKRRLDLLSPRETEVMELVITGMLNKQIAAKLNIAEKTVKVHRARVMEKMQVESVAQLVRAAELAGVMVPAETTCC